MTDVPSKPSFATNRPGERVADAINAHLAHLQDWNKSYDLAISTAYFNPGGFGLLADELEKVDSVRILLGAEPERPERRIRPLADSADPARAARARVRSALVDHERTLEQDRDLLGFDIESDETAHRLVQWLQSGRVEVRRLETGFLHGKAFIVTTDNEGVIAGSSNFTYAGLAVNIELNLGDYNPPVVAQVVDWFEDLWVQAEPFDLAGLYSARYEPHSPYLVYLRMLCERYGEELRAEAEESQLPGIHLAAFNKDGVWRARRILRERRGVVLADEVGLGKTFQAGELIREAVQDRRQRVLVVAPATLRDGMWKKFLATNMLSVDLLSYDDLAMDRQLNPNASAAKLHFDRDEYAMVVIDEAHNLRNPLTERANAVRALLAGSPPKDVVLMTATPVNNSLWDLYYLLAFFIRNDAEFADSGIRSIRDHFAAAMAMNPDDLSPEHLFDILDAVAVRRTRSFVKAYYPNDTIKLGGVDVPIVFPTPKVRKVAYDLDDVLPDFFERFAEALDGDRGEANPNVLSLARYAPSGYLCDGDIDAHEIQMSGLLRSGMLKRFESSTYAFARTCRRMMASHDAFLALIENGKVATGQALADWVATDSDDAEDVDRFMDHHVDVLEDASDYDVDALIADVQADRELLDSLATEAEGVTADQDPKLEALIDQLARIAAEAEAEGIGEQDVRDKRKVLVFSYFADTVEWITDHLHAVAEADVRLAAYRGRITSISGSAGTKEDVLFGFAPRTTDAPTGSDEDRFDLVVTTDVLSEGVNLQQARHIINYDLPWNPMRLVQRHGRIDRIGSTHSQIFMRCFFPDERLDDLLGLEERLHRKIAQAAAAVGVNEVLPGSRSTDRTFAETREEIERLRDEDAGLLERGGNRRSALSGEEYRQELRRALENDDLAARITRLPWGSGSGMAVQRPHADPGYVFCARVGDHPRPVFRYVNVADPTEPVIVDDTLACLDHARPDDGPDTPRVLDAATYVGSFDAWRHAAESIVESWNLASDPANLVASIPRAMQRAIELVRAARPPSMTQEAADHLVESLEAPYPERIVRTIRAALAASGTDMERVELIARTAHELGLEPATPPERLPRINEDDVHLVCWLAIVPGGPTMAEQLGELPLGDQP